MSNQLDELLEGVKLAAFYEELFDEAVALANPRDTKMVGVEGSAKTYDMMVDVTDPVTDLEYEFNGLLKNVPEYGKNPRDVMKKWPVTKSAKPGEPHQPSVGQFKISPDMPSGDPKDKMTPDIEEGEYLYAWHLTSDLPANTTEGMRKRVLGLVSTKMEAMASKLGGEELSKHRQTSSQRSKDGLAITHRGMMTLPVGPDEMPKNLTEYISRLSILPKGVGGEDLAESIKGLTEALKEMK